MGVVLEFRVISADTGRVDNRFVVAAGVAVAARRAIGAVAVAAVAAAVALGTRVVVVVALFLSLSRPDSVDVAVVVLEGGSEVVGV